MISHSLPWSEVEPLLSYWPDLGHLLTPEIKGESQPPAHRGAGTGEGAAGAEWQTGSAHPRSVRPGRFTEENPCRELGPEGQTEAP